MLKYGDIFRLLGGDGNQALFSKIKFLKFIKKCNTSDQFHKQFFLFKIIDGDLAGREVKAVARLSGGIEYSLDHSNLAGVVVELMPEGYEDEIHTKGDTFGMGVIVTSNSQHFDNE